MPEERWQRVKELFGAALELPAAARDAYLRQSCGSDEALRQDVELLLKGESAAGAFLSRSPGLETSERSPALAAGRSLGVYRIVGPIGAGGMGEVYKALDTHLGREVAIKVLPDLFVKDPDRLVRFEREARVLAALNHPNIASVFGFEQSDGTRFLIMELVPGETLAERLHEGALPVKEALPIAQQIAEALEEAHAKGIVHRDLKPANVKVTTAGKVKVLDFGLAKALAPDSQPSDPAESPTLTRAGAAIVGTAAYMSPEQARGKAVDKRTDVWAFGCVLFEMLTGRPTFAGETVSDTIANILKHDPDWTRLPAETPGRVRDVLRRCLQKDPHQRLHDIADARIELGEALAGDAVATTVATQVRGATRSWIPWAVAALATVVAAAALLSGQPRAAAPSAQQTIRFLVNPPEQGFAPTGDSSFPQFAISPDGRRLVFVAFGPDRRRMLWVRPLDSLTAVPMPGTADARFPFWSPDGGQVGFFAQNKLKKTDLAGGTPQTLADAPGEPRGGSWNSDGVILYAPLAQATLYKINAAGGGASTLVTERDESIGDTSHRWPHFLPDGRHFLFTRRATSAKRGIYLGSLDSKATVALAGELTNAVFAPPAHILFSRGGSLVAAPFDLQRGTISDPYTVADRIAHSVSLHYGGFSVAPSGVLVYASGDSSTTRLEWFDRRGQRLRTVGEPGNHLHVRLSPDEKQIAVAKGDAQTSNYDLWLLEPSGGGAVRFTFDPSSERFPVWSPRGDQIVFASQATRGQADLTLKPTSGATPETLISTEHISHFPYDWSRDGRWVAYHGLGTATGHGTGWDIYLYDSVERKTTSFVTQPANEVQPQFGPDGRWIAYASDESGRFEVYVQPFPATGSKWQLSTGGGSQPRWRKDGKELFYVAQDGMLMAVPVDASGSFKRGTPQPLFRTQLPALEMQFGNDYAVTGDGQRFLVNTVLTSGGFAPLTVVVNWKATEQRAR